MFKLKRPRHQPAKLVVQAAPWQEAELERLAQKINEAGMASPARLLLAGGKPVSFVGSQFLLLLQPLAQLGLGGRPAAGVESFSRLLEKRSNLDTLLQKLDELEPGNDKNNKKEQR